MTDTKESPIQLIPKPLIKPLRISEIFPLQQRLFATNTTAPQKLNNFPSCARQFETRGQLFTAIYSPASTVIICLQKFRRTFLKQPVATGERVQSGPKTSVINL